MSVEDKNQSQEQPKQEAIEDIDLEKLALKLGWENAESKEHLKGNYGNQDISAYGYMEGYIKGFKAALLSQQNPNSEKQIAERIAGYIHEIDSLRGTIRELVEKILVYKEYIKYVNVSDDMKDSEYNKFCDVRNKMHEVGNF